MTIEHLGETEVHIREIFCGEDFPERLKRVNVQEIAKSAQEIGILQPPMVRASDMQLIFGGDRVASYVVNKQPRFVVRMVECDDETVRKIREVENTHRRHETPQEILQMVREQEKQYLEAEVKPHCDQHAKHSDLCEKCVRMVWSMKNGSVIEFTGGDEEPQGADELLPDGFVGSEKQDPKPRGRGRPKTTRGLAREEVAAATGRSPDAVRKAAERAARAEAKPKAAPTAPMDAVFELWGTEQPAEWLADLGTARQKFTAAAGKLATAQGLIKQVSVEVPDLLALWEGVQGQAAAIRQARPACVCAWCKNLSTMVKQCKACGGRGWLNEAQMVHVPETLREPRAVNVAGGQLPEEDFTGSEVFE